jgi:GAF domain-containing protein
MERSRATIEKMSAMQASLDDVHRAVCHDIVDHVGSSRASIWYFDASGETLTSACLLDARTDDTESGQIMTRADDLPYFEAIDAGHSIHAVDAARHPATSCFRDKYLVPLQIASLLDFPIKVRGKTVAVLCCEHGPAVKHWTAENEEYLHQMAILLGLSIMIGRHTPV